MGHAEVPPEYAKFFDAARLRDNLLLGALYLATFEVLKLIIIDEIVSFYAFSHDRDGKPTKWVAGIDTKTGMASLPGRGVRAPYTTGVRHQDGRTHPGRQRHPRHRRNS